MLSKLIKIAVAILLVGCFSVPNANSLTKSNATLSDFIGIEVNSFDPVITLRCTAGGNNCNFSVILDSEVSTFEGIENAYLIEIEFKEIFSIYQGDIKTKFNHNINGFRLPKDYKLEIVSCHDFPNLEGTILDLSEKIISDSGTVTVKLIK